MPKIEKSEEQAASGAANGNASCKAIDAATRGPRKGASRIDRAVHLVAQGYRLKDIATLLGFNWKQSLHYHLQRSKAYRRARSKALDIPRKGESRRSMRWRINRMLERLQHVKREGLGYRGNCQHCGEPRAVYALPGADGGRAECHSCGWKGRCDVYVLGRESPLLYAYNALKRKRNVT